MEKHTHTHEIESYQMQKKHIKNKNSYEMLFSKYCRR